MGHHHLGKGKIIIITGILIINNKKVYNGKASAK
jgi:hypothetical protein